MVVVVDVCKFVFTKPLTKCNNLPELGILVKGLIKKCVTQNDQKFLFYACELSQGVCNTKGVQRIIYYHVWFVICNEPLFPVGLQDSIPNPPITAFLHIEGLGLITT